jgi:hypothetical protein
MKMKPVLVRQGWEDEWNYIAKVFRFEYVKVSPVYQNNIWNNRYSVIRPIYTVKSHIDRLILTSGNRYKQYIIASILYYLYACDCLIVEDIDYPSYALWREKHGGMTLDHKLPRYWFPKLTFDCSNWQPLSRQANKDKRDHFLREGGERLDFLADELLKIKSKYL